jgi:hypothetical protein
MVGAFFAVFSGAASADPAVVYTYARGTSACSGSGFGGYYLSTASTTVFKDGSLRLLQCHAVLVSGTSVTTTQIVHSNSPGGVCTTIFSPAGILNYECVLSS